MPNEEYYREKYQPKQRFGKPGHDPESTTDSHHRQVHALALAFPNEFFLTMRTNTSAREVFLVMENLSNKDHQSVGDPVKSPARAICLESFNRVLRFARAHIIHFRLGARLTARGPDATKCGR